MTSTSAALPAGPNMTLDNHDSNESDLPVLGNT